MKTRFCPLVVFLVGAFVSSCRDDGGIAPGTEGGPCYGDGTCNAGLTCNTRNICEQDTSDPCDGVACSGHGTCVDNDGTAECDCDTGYHPDGLDCVQDEDVCAGVTCSGHGTCVDNDGTAECDCDTGYHPDGLDCVQDEDVCAGVTCSGHGTCVDNDGTAECDCDAGYYPDGLDCTDLGLIWVSMPGGTFQMGDTLAQGSVNEQPVHSVTLSGFEITKTEVTVRQYAVCVAAGSCTAPTTGANCNWNDPGYEEHPVNCVTWYQAKVFCTWAGGRLPTEAEWEYAARSGGQDNLYPWGFEEANCTYAVMDEYTGAGCGTGRTMAVCSKPEGNTEQGLCDMAGNVWEWVEDDWHHDYSGAPTDGSAWVDNPRGSGRMERGGSLYFYEYELRASFRLYGDSPSHQDGGLGIRCAR